MNRVTLDLARDTTQMAALKQERVRLTLLSLRACCATLRCGGAFDVPAVLRLVALWFRLCGQPAGEKDAVAAGLHEQAHALLAGAAGVLSIASSKFVLLTWQIASRLAAGGSPFQATTTATPHPPSPLPPQQAAHSPADVSPLAAAAAALPR